MAGPLNDLPLPPNRDPLVARVDELLHRLESINAAHDALGADLQRGQQPTSVTIPRESDQNQSPSSWELPDPVRAGAESLAAHIARIDALARAVGAEEERAAELVARVNEAWDRLDRLTSSLHAESLSGSSAAEDGQPILPTPTPDPVPAVAIHHQQSPPGRRQPSTRAVGVAALTALVLLSAATVALSVWGDDSEAAPVSPSSSTATSPADVVEGTATPSLVALIPESAPSPTSVPSTPSVPVTTPPRGTATPTAPPTVTPSPIASPDASGQTGVFSLQQGIGASREEIELALGDREYVRDGLSYYLEGTASVELDDDTAQRIVVEFADPPSVEQLAELLERIRPDDARLSDTSTGGDAGLQRVFESASIRDRFGDDRRYVERVCLDTATGEILGFEIAVEFVE